MSTDRAIIEIRDLGLAAALVTASFAIFDTHRDTHGRVYFEFKDSPGLRKTVDRYWADTLDVKARLYADNTKMLKSRIYGGH